MTPHLTIDRASADAVPAQRFALYTTAELLALPAPEWLLDKHLPENSLAVLYGPSGIGKSFLALAWSLNVATHTPWLQWATRWGPVLYVSAEGTAGIVQRVNAYREAHELTRHEDKILFLREPVNLMNVADVDALLASWQNLETGLKPALVVVDTFSRCIAGADENSSQDVSRAIASCDRIRRATDGAVLLLHHTGKTGDLERGSSALRGAADAMFSMRSEDGALVVTCEKQRDAAPVEPQRLKLTPFGGSCIIEPCEGSVAGSTLTPNERKALEGLAAVEMEGGATSGEWQASSQLIGGSYYRARKRLVGLGHVRWEGKRKRYSLTPLGLASVLPTTTSLP